MPRCKNCGEKFTPRFSSLEKFCKEEKCNEAAIQYAIENKKRLDAKKERKRIKEEKRKLLTLSDHKKKFQTLINEIARLIDENQSCISCQNQANKYDAGHRFTVKAWGNIRFNLHNIHKQCVNCNQYNGGQETQYDEGLIQRYGQDYKDNVHGLKVKYKDLKLTIPEIEAARKKALSVRHGLKNGIEISRDLANKMIGIYL